ncbi:MAG: chemotaxis-specific protein-glutamate methyltransferase CheB [Acidobacteriota bacterium]
MISVLIVEDSPVQREALAYILNSAPDIEVIGYASNGEEAVEASKQYQPKVITMDIHMPGMDGFETTRRIMRESPTRIVIVSASWQSTEVEKSFQAMQAGALAIIEKPPGLGHPDYERAARELVQIVRLMSEVQVIRRRAQRPDDASTPLVSSQRHTPAQATKKIKLVAIGASTGGPPVLQTILAGLPKNFAAPVLIVQHIGTGFAQGFVNWLTHATDFPVHLASAGDTLLPGHAYVAPDGFHTGLNAQGRISLSKDAPENHLRPSVSYSFRSVAQICGGEVVGVLLTGMGKDGAEELKLLRELGAITIAQDEESSVVFGMPGEAVKLEAAQYVLSPNEIIALLCELIGKTTV